MSYTNYRLVAVEELDLEEKQQWTPSFVCIQLAKDLRTKTPWSFLATGASIETVSF